MASFSRYIAKFIASNFTNGRSVADKIIRLGNEINRCYLNLDKEDKEIFTIASFIKDKLDDERYEMNWNYRHGENFNQMLSSFIEDDFITMEQIADNICDNLDKEIYGFTRPDKAESDLEKILIAYNAAFRVVGAEEYDDKSSILRFIEKGSSTKAKSKAEMNEEVERWERVTEFADEHGFLVKEVRVKGMIQIARFLKQNTFEENYSLESSIDELKRKNNHDDRELRKILDKCKAIINKAFIEKKICENFKKGYCKFGDKGRMSHIKSEQAFFGGVDESSSSEEKEMSDEMSSSTVYRSSGLDCSWLCPRSSNRGKGGGGARHTRSACAPGSITPSSDLRNASAPPRVANQKSSVGLTSL